MFAVHETIRNAANDATPQELMCTRLARTLAERDRQRAGLRSAHEDSLCARRPPGSSVQVVSYHRTYEEFPISHTYVLSPAALRRRTR